MNGDDPASAREPLPAAMTSRPAAALVCYTSRSKLLLLSVAACAMVAVSWFCTRMHRPVAWVAGWAGVALFGFGVGISLVRFFRRGPQLIVSDEGLDDRRFGAGVVPWREIAALCIRATRSQRFLCVDVVDEAALLARVPRMRRWLVAGNSLIDFPRWTISFADLTPGLDEVWAHLEAMGYVAESREPEPLAPSDRPDPRG